jgi:hypothetical protein
MAERSRDGATKAATRPAPPSGEAGGFPLLGERGKGREGLWGEWLYASSPHYAGGKKWHLKAREIVSESHVHGDPRALYSAHR